MKFYLKIIFLLAVLIFVTYRVIVALGSDTNDKGVLESVKENFTANTTGSAMETGYSGVPVMSASVYKMQYYSSLMNY